MERYDALAVMRARLSETGYYKTDGSSLTDAELAAYDAGMQLLLEAMAELERELRLSAAQSYGLTLWEAAIGLCHKHLPLARRREMLRAYLSVGKNDNSLDAVQRQLQAVGIRAVLTESPDTGSLLVTVTDASDLQDRSLQAISELAQRFLPAHLEIVYDLSAIA